ncbi:MAG TPA: N-methyl-L-tryptophan oxidase [Pirellulales bacterium]|nr:N-methyl-L-tryptophan oxidase [Pirellulales bacterium]
MSYDAIVLGTGGVGGAALCHLARRGARVIGLDRFDPGHDRGSSHGVTRIIRQAYYEHPDYVPLVLRAYELWAELSRQCGIALVSEVGLLQVGPPDGEVLGGVLASAARYGLDVERLEARAILARWPGFRVGDALAGVFERRAGFLRVEACVMAHVAQAVAHGAQLRVGCQVQSWRADGAGVVVDTSQGRFAAGALVIAAGAWAAEMLDGLGLAFEVRRKPVFWFAGGAEYRAEHCPCFLFETSSGIFYGMPQIDEWGVKAAEHTGGAVVDDPSALDRRLDPADQSRVENFLSAHLPRVVAGPTRHSVCMYTMTRDAHFVVDRHPLHPQVVFAAGLSGHGFKFVPVLGEALADLATTGQTPLPIGFLSCQRWIGDRGQGTG